MIDRFTDNSKKLMALARQRAIDLQHDAISPEHLLLALLELDGCSAQSLLAQRGLAAAELREVLLVVMPKGAAGDRGAQLPFTPSVKQLLERMCDEAASRGRTHLGTEDVLHALTLVEGTLARDVLAKLGITAKVVQEQVLRGGPFDRRRVRLLLISNSTMHGGGYLSHCQGEIRNFLGPRQRVLFVPYALHDHDAYAAKAAQAFGEFGHDLVSVHAKNHSPKALDDADAVFIGGGNTFRLLAALYHYGLRDAIRERALAGMPYIGSSAGTNVATPSIRTTNDMPIVQPPAFAALQLVPFQINPHYLDADPGSTHMGETREQRLQQFHEEHATPVLGMREGCLLRVEGERAELRGSTRARLFRRGTSPVEYTPPCDLSFLLAD